MKKIGIWAAFVLMAAMVLGGTAVACDPCDPDCDPDCDPQHMDVTAEVPFACEIDPLCDLDMGCLEVDDCKIVRDGMLKVKANCNWEVNVEDNSDPQQDGHMRSACACADLSQKIQVKLDSFSAPFDTWTPVCNSCTVVTPCLPPTGSTPREMCIGYKQCVTWDDVCAPDYKITITFYVQPC